MVVRANGPVIFEVTGPRSKISDWTDNFRNLVRTAMNKRFKFQHKPLISNECERKEDKTVDGSFEIVVKYGNI